MKTRVINIATQIIPRGVARHSVSFLLFLVLLIIGELISSGYLSLGHLAHLITLAAPLGLMTVGQTFVILSGKEDIDFSAGANASLAIVLGALLLQKFDLWVVIILTLLVGALSGVVNGVGVRVMKIPPLVMTFGTAMILYGVGQGITRGMSLGTSTPLLTTIAIGRFFGVPIAFLVWIGVLAMAEMLLNQSIYGRWLYASGSNPRAAHISGISNTLIGVTAYSISGVLSALAGLLYLGRFTIPSGFRMAEMYTLPSIMAVILGGTNFSGGEGSLIGSVGGVLTLTVLESFFSIFNISQAWRNVLSGFMLLIILVFYARREKIRI